MKSWLFFFLGIVVGVSSLFVKRLYVPPPRDPTVAFQPSLVRHVNFMETLSRERPAVVFLGDSITELWCDHPDLWMHYFGPHAVNFGMSGHRAENVLWRIEDGEIDSASVKTVVLMIGINNLGDGNNTVEQTVAGIARLVGAIRSRPNHPRVLLLGILPVGQFATDPMRGKVRSVNVGISQLADGDGVRFFDFGNRLLEPDGSLSAKMMADFLHPARKAFVIWGEAVGPLIEDHHRTATTRG